MPKQTKHRRFPAEWEPQDAVQLTFPHRHSDWAPVLESVTPCFVAIARAVTAFQPLVVVCDDVERVKSLLPDIPPEKLFLLDCPSNDTWARDHGGITVLENDQPVVLDFVFNGWGLKFPANLDNGITACMAAQGLFRHKPQHGGLVLEGGALETDGKGTLLTTAECLLSPNRNPHLSKTEIEQHLARTLGIERVLWLHHGYLAGDDTDSHIDTLARFCSDDTIAYVTCTDPADEHYPALQEMERELKNFKQADGTPYRLAPLPWPDACYDAAGERLPATYANFLIINGAVLAPLYGVPQDEMALEVFHNLFPRHKIVGINCRMLIEQHGSLHCVTMQYPAGTLSLNHRT